MAALGLISRCPLRTFLSTLLVSSLRFSLLFFLVFLVAGSFGCEARQKRPYGYHNLGLLRDVMKPETYVPQHRLMVRLDAKGFSVMSTACTYDLSALEKQSRDGRIVWESNTTDSLYDEFGKVIHGPATVHLPYFEVKISSSEYGDSEKALYAYVGNEVDAAWRLAVP